MASEGEIDRLFWVYLEELHAWSMRVFAELWDRMDPDDFDGSYRRIYKQVVVVHERAVAAALFSSDDYVSLKAAAGRWWVAPDWREAKSWWKRPTELRGGVPAADVLARVPWSMKAVVGAGEGPSKAMDLGRARVARVLGTDPSAVARNYLREFVAVEGGPEVRDLSRTEKLVRGERIVPPGEPIPSSLELPSVGGTGGDQVFKFWRRVPRPGACDFCLMLATRGAVYSSRRAAMFSTDGRRYHDFCRCRAQLVVRARSGYKTGELEGVVDPVDANRLISFRAQTGKTYTYDLGGGVFNLGPPKPGWL